MKRRIFFLSLLISLLIISSYILFFNEKNKYRLNSNFIDATITNIFDDSIEIYTIDGKLYNVKYINSKYSIGDNIRIKYNGSFDNFKSLQNINIINISYSGVSKDKNDIDKIINDMSLSEKIGQLLLARVPLEGDIDIIKTYNIGGYILFDKDVDNRSKSELQTYIGKLQNASKIPLFIAIDEEGGKVSRLSSNKKIVETPFKSPQELYNVGGLDEVLKDAVKKRNLLNELEININLAPVADVALNNNSYIYPRTFGKDYNNTADYIKTVMNSQNEYISYVLKHFPGYSDNTDTHSNIAIDSRDCKTIFNNDFIPFKAGINNGARMVMFSHNIVTCFDSFPASISRKAHNILIDELGYNGISLTDDLSMKAISDTGLDNIYVKAILAGNNILIVTDVAGAFSEIKEAIQTKQINEILLDKLIYPNIELKRKMHLIRGYGNMGFY